MDGISVEIADGLAHIEFLDRSLVGSTLKALLDAGGPGALKVDTGGTKRTYIVPESVAAQVGLIGSQDAADTPKRRTRARASTTD